MDAAIGIALFYVALIILIFSAIGVMVAIWNEPDDKNDNNVIDDLENKEFNYLAPKRRERKNKVHRK